MRVKKQQLELCMEQVTDSGLRTDYDKVFFTVTRFHLYAQHIMKNARVHELQAGIKISRRNINNLKYADNTTLVAGSEEELKNLFMWVERESGKSWLKTQY